MRSALLFGCGNHQRHFYVQPRDASPHCVATQWGDVVKKPTCCGAMCATCAAATIGRAANRNCGTANKMGAA